MDQDIRFDKNRGCAVNNMAYDEDALHEECGVFGMYDFDGSRCSIYDLLWIICITAQRTGKLRYCG